MPTKPRPLAAPEKQGFSMRSFLASSDLGAPAVMIAALAAAETLGLNLAL